MSNYFFLNATDVTPHYSSEEPVCVTFLATFKDKSGYTCPLFSQVVHVSKLKECRAH